MRSGVSLRNNGHNVDIVAVQDVRQSPGSFIHWPILHHCLVHAHLCAGFGQSFRQDGRGDKSTAFGRLCVDNHRMFHLDSDL